MKEIAITALLTVAIVANDIIQKQQTRIYWYTIYFFMVWFLLWGSKSHADELYIQGNTYAIESIDGVTFGESREDIIMKMIEHKRGHDQALKRSANMLKNYKLYSPDVEELYRAAFSAVSTYAGSRNFLLPAIVAILEYVGEQGWKTLKIYQAYITHMYEAEYHAEMFDFYMKILLQYQKEIEV